MKKRIKFYIVAVALLCVSLLIVFTLFWIKWSYTNVTQRNIDSILKTTVELTDNITGDPNGFAMRLNDNMPEGSRTTLIARDGTVLGDSAVDYKTMENHSNRSELINALKYGYGENVRKSDTTHVDTMYVARMLNNDVVLRLAMPVTVMDQYVSDLLIFLAVLLIFFAIIVAPISDRLSDRIIAPLKVFSKSLSLENIISDNAQIDIKGVEYDELIPIVSNFNSLFDRIKEYIDKISEQSSDLEYIMDSMQEGLLILDSKLNILLLNKKALSFLGFSTLGENRNFTILCRNKGFISAVHGALDNSLASTYDIESDGRIIRAFISPTDKNSGILYGVTILLADVTRIVQLERIRSDFVANVSHELKTPVTSINGFAELINNGMITDDEKIKHYTGLIMEESQRLIEIINDTLKLSELESVKIEAEEESIDLFEMFSDIKNILSTQCRNKNITFNISGEGTILADRGHIMEMGVNLIDNAIKYNRENGKIDVIISHTPRSTSFTVKDTGIGIPPDQQSRVFERFYRVDRSRNRKTGGSGLGLSIVKHIAERYGAQIKLESDFSGTSISVTFGK